MKNIFRILLSVQISLICGLTNAQVIDLSTGIYSNGQLIPVNSFDDSWTVCPPGSNPSIPTSFVPVPCGSGILAGSGGNTYAGKDATIRWLSPYLNAAGEHLATAPAGTYYYKMSFNLTSACVQSATLNLTHAGADNLMDMIYINQTNSYPVNYTFGPFGNASFSVSGLVQGQNEIMVRVNNTSSFTGMEIKGNITMQYNCCCVDFLLKDKNGNEKTNFCMDEDVFWTAHGALKGTYVMSIWNGSWQVATKSLTSMPGNMSIKDMFGNMIPWGGFQPNVNYEVRLSYNSPCGTQVVTKQFRFYCCPNSPDASFTLTKKGMQLEGKSPANGSHTWTIRRVSKDNGTVLYEEVIYDTGWAKFLFNNEWDCYLVTHKVVNACGTASSIQRLCYFECDEKKCNLAAPTNLMYNPGMDLLSWDPLAGASSYIIETIINGCCGSHIISASDVSTTSVPNQTSYIMDFPGNNIQIQCYAVRVYAVCPDGSRSMASNMLCVFP